MVKAEVYGAVLAAFLWATAGGAIFPGTLRWIAPIACPNHYLNAVVLSKTSYYTTPGGGNGVKGSAALVCITEAREPVAIHFLSSSAILLGVTLPLFLLLAFALAWLWRVWLSDFYDRYIDDTAWTQIPIWLFIGGCTTMFFWVPVVSQIGTYASWQDVPPIASPTPSLGLGLGVATPLAVPPNDPKAGRSLAERAKLDRIKKWKEGACDGVSECFTSNDFAGNVAVTVTASISETGRITGAKTSGDVPPKIRSCLIDGAKQKRLDGFDGGPGRRSCRVVGMISGGTRMVSIDSKLEQP